MTVVKMTHLLDGSSAEPNLSSQRCSQRRLGSVQARLHLLPGGSRLQLRQKHGKMAKLQHLHVVWPVLNFCHRSKGKIIQLLSAYQKICMENRKDVNAQAVP
ncbi:uncharacterized protein WM294_005027 isoform 2-T8 [Sarcoramphus papa]